ncbi:MAG: phage portal protein, partial [Candidatus Dormibacteria bacterium]
MADKELVAYQQAYAQSEPVDASFMRRLKLSVRYLLSGKTQGWFGPGQPIQPVAPPDTIGRQFDFPSYINTNIDPKAFEGIDFNTLRSLADAYDLLRLLLETRKDQICKLDWSIGYKDESRRADDRTRKITEFFALPYRDHTWAEWLRMLLEDMLVVDAATLYPRMNKGGGLYALEPMDGTTIKRVIDNFGRTPLHPDPAYQQKLKGLPAIDYSRDQLIYKPRNIRTFRLYGFSPVEQMVLRVQTSLRRDLYTLQYYSEGSTPDLIFSVPADWTAQQVQDFEKYFNGLLSGNSAARSRAKFVPDGMKPIDTKERSLTDKFDEWLARIFCYGLGMSVQPFVSSFNRATAENASEAAKEDGLGPQMAWVVSLMNYVLAHPLYFNSPDLEFVWQEEDETDALTAAEIVDKKIRAGLMSINEARDSVGLEPIEDGDSYLIYTPQGAVTVESVVNPPELADALAQTSFTAHEPNQSPAQDAGAAPGAQGDQTQGTQAAEEEGKTAQARQAAQAHQASHGAQKSQA